MTELPDPATMLAWNRSDKLTGFRHMADLFAADRADPDPSYTYPLPVEAQIEDVIYRIDGSEHTLADYFERQRVTALLVVKDGRILHETYLHGTDENTHWTSWSVGKSVVSTLVGIALKEGAIGALDDPVSRYVPELTGSAYADVPLRDMLRMSSGVAWSEDPTTPEPNVRTFADCLARQEVGSILEMARSLPRAVDPETGDEYPPGVRWNYSNVEAFLTGLVLERATGERISRYLERHVWQPFGMERPVWWMAEGPGGANSGAGDFSATLRDYARIGQFVLDGGVLPDGTEKLPHGWLAEATTWPEHTFDPRYPTAAPGKYGYFWWNRPPERSLDPEPATSPFAEETFLASGLFGQYIFINPRTRMIMVQWSVYDTPPVDAPVSEAATLFNAFTTASTDVTRPSRGKT